MDSKVLPQQSSTTKSVSASEIPKVMQFLESKSNNRLEFLVDDSNTEIGMNRSHEENLTLTTTLTDQIKMVTNSYGKSNYTFELIEQADKSSTYFLNLVVKEYKDEFYMYIVKYVPDTTWLETHHMIKDFNVFTGSIYFYSDIGTYIGKVDMANGVASSGFDKHPCDDESSESENTNNGSSTTSSNNGTTGGNSGGLDCYPYLMWYECGGENSNIPHDTTGPLACGVPGGSGSDWTLVIVCQESFRDLQNVLRHPCDGGSNGGGASTSSLSCETITGNTCDNLGDILMEWDENCNCVEAEAIEGSVVSTVYFEKEYQMFLDDLDLSDEQHEFLDNLLEDNPDIDQELQDYLLENGFSEEAEAFVEEAVEALEDGGEVDFPEKVILDESFVNETKLKCVYDKLTEDNSSLFRNTIATFIDNPSFNLTFKVGNCNETDDACADDSNPNNIVITIEDVSSSPIELAQLILHEAIHAEIAKFVKEYESGVDVNNRPYLFQLYKYYNDLYSSGDIDHIYMTSQYINPLASALRQFDNNNYPLNYYKSFAWDGLRKWETEGLMEPYQDVYEDFRPIVLNDSEVCE